MNLAIFNLLEGHERDAEALRYATVALALGWPPDVVPMNIVHSKAAQHAGRFFEAGELMKKSHRGGVAPAGLGALIDQIYFALADTRQASAACNSIRSFVQTLGAGTMPATLPMLLMHWSVSLGDVDLAYEIGNRALDDFERQRVFPVEGFVPQLWVNEMQPFRRDARFHQFAGERLRLMDFWKEHGPPDGCEIRNGRLHVMR